MQNFWKTVWYTLTHITFKGRTSRKDYLYWFLFNILFSVCVLLLVSLPARMIRPHIPELSIGGQLMATVYFLAASVVTLIVSIWKFIADITISVRRFHDFGKSAWWPLLWYWLIAFVVTLILGIGLSVAYVLIAHAGREPQVSTLIVQVLMLLNTIVYVAISLFKKGDVGENKYGLPSELNRD